MPINSIGTAVGAMTTVPGSGLSGAANGKSENGFGDALGQLVTAAERAGSDANTAVVNMLDGSTDVHETMIALQRADLTLQMTVQVRNKLVQAYQEIMRMPV